MEEKISKPNITPCNINCSFCFLNYTEQLHRNFLFRNHTPDEVGQIVKSIHHQVKEYPKGALIFQSGDTYAGLQLIIEGAVIGEIIDFEGRTIRIEELRAPDTIGSAFLFGDDNRLPVNVTATENTRLLIIQRDELVKLFRTNVKLLYNYLDIISNRAQYLSRKIKLLGLQSIKGKVAHYLLDQVNKSENDTLKLSNTQLEIAELFGVTRPSLSRVLRELHHTGYISAKGKNITIINKTALSGLLR
jgi:CRP-like cAMP-binding protein